jgi:hypothetical protein
MRNRTSWLLQFRPEPIDLRPSPAALFLALFWHHGPGFVIVGTNDCFE